MVIRIPRGCVIAFAAIVLIALAAYGFISYRIGQVRGLRSASEAIDKLIDRSPAPFNRTKRSWGHETSYFGEFSPGSHSPPEHFVIVYVDGERCATAYYDANGQLHSLFMLYPLNRIESSGWIYRDDAKMAEYYASTKDAAGTAIRGTP